MFYAGSRFMIPHSETSQMGSCVQDFRRSRGKFAGIIGTAMHRDGEVSGLKVKKLRGSSRGTSPVPGNKSDVGRKAKTPHEIAQFGKIAEPVLGLQQRIINNQASASFLGMPGHIRKHESDEQDEGNRRAEMFFDVVKTSAYRLIDVDYLRAGAKENRRALVLEPYEDRNIFCRDYSRKPGCG